LRTRNFSNPKAIPTSQNAVRNADRQGSHNATAIVVTEASVRCFPPPVLNVAIVPKFLSNLVMIGRFIAVTAIEKSDPIDK
jgi:hypothetical protein